MMVPRRAHLSPSLTVRPVPMVNCEHTADRPRARATTVPSTLSRLASHTVVSAKQKAMKLSRDGWCCTVDSNDVRCYTDGFVCRRVSVRLSSWGKGGGARFSSNDVTAVTCGVLSLPESSSSSALFR